MGFTSALLTLCTILIFSCYPLCGCLPTNCVEVVSDSLSHHPVTQEQTCRSRVSISLVIISQQGCDVDDGGGEHNYGYAQTCQEKVEVLQVCFSVS